MRVEDIALVSPFSSGRRTQQKNLAQVAGGSIKSPAGSASEGRHLGRAGFHQIDELIFAGDGENVSAIAGACEQTAMRVECQPVNQVFFRCPYSGGRAIRRDAINLRSTAGSAARTREADRRRRRARTGTPDRHARWSTGGGNRRGNRNRRREKTGRSAGGMLLAHAGGVNAAVL